MQSINFGKIMCICLISLFFSNYILADEASIKAGESKALACKACHGVEKSNNPEWPNLSQQSKKYLIEQLHQFRDGIRKNALMGPQAMGLSDQDIIDLSNYYNNIQAIKGKISASNDTIELGQEIYRAGIEEREIPACISCHGPQGLGISRTGYPKISGQHAPYLKGRLEKYKEDYDNRESYGKNFSIMSAISFKLSSKEMKALAEYLQGLY